MLSAANHRSAWVINRENTKVQNWSMDPLKSSVCYYYFDTFFVMLTFVQIETSLI